MKWLRSVHRRVRYVRRRVRYRLCWLKFHDIVSDQIAFGYYGPDRLLPDGTVERGDSLEWKTVRCNTCGKL